MENELHKTIFFLLWAETEKPNMMYGGHTIKEAIDALANIMGVDAEKMRQLVK